MGGFLQERNAGVDDYSRDPGGHVRRVRPSAESLRRTWRDFRGRWMKRLAILVLAGFLGGGIRAAEVVRFAIGEWAPYTGRGLEQSGMAAEVVSAACKAAGLEAEFTFFPWKRAEANVETGAFFATFPYRETPDRALKFHYSETLYTSTNAILLHRGNPRTAHFKYSGAEDLKAFKVGTLAGSDAISNPLRKAGIQVEEVQNVQQNLQKLEGQRIDCVIDDKPVLFQAIRTHDPDPGRRNLFWFGEGGFGPATEYKLLVSRRFPGAQERLEKFNAGLRRIKQNGEFQRILKRFGL
jgi:polar amino acid transport system substrate-binding protein